MRKRVDQLGVAEPEIQRTGSEEIDVALPNVSNAGRAQAQVGKTALLYFYDWEPNVIGPDGKPAPTEATVTGGAEAASSISGLVEYKAVQRAAKRPAILRKNDTTLRPGCTPEQKEGCIYGSWYLLDTNTSAAPKSHLRGPRKPRRTYTRTATNRRRARRQRRCASTRHGGRAGPPGGRRKRQGHAGLAEQLVRAQRRPGADGLGHQEPGGGLEKANRARADVNFGFTSHGKSVFQQVTKEIAQRGQEAQLPGVSKEAALQHFAIVLDGQVITAPSIDYTSTRKGSTPPPARRSPAASRRPPRKTSPTSCSPARCRSS